MNKKWKTTIGGAIALEPRIKFEVKDIFPGPGRYEPSLNLVKPKQPSYYIAEKGNITSIKNVTGTNENVSSNSYRTEIAGFTSKHLNPPKWSLPVSERKGLDMKVWTKNETYYIYK